jgi:predicted enzyme related to lactoylglutathione lyase
MPVIERYETGMFSWADLATTDVMGAKGFYGELFGCRSAATTARM